MTLTRTLRRAMTTTLMVGAFGLSLGGCSSLPFFGDKKDGGADKAATPAEAASAAAARAEYRLEIDAPSDAKKLLGQFLDLARFQTAPAADAVDAQELERLRRATPAQARGLLETQGYFNAKVTADRIDEAGAAKPLIKVVVVLGPPTKVAAVDISATGALKIQADRGDAAAARELGQLSRDWTLRTGDTFTQSAWGSAKSASIAELRANGYASADWASTSAQIDAPDNTAKLAAEAASGPLYLLGPLTIKGLKLYPDRVVRNLAEFGDGTPYTEKTLLDFQDRLSKVGLFEGVSVQLDPNVATADAAPVTVQLREQPVQDVTFGAGYSTNTGPRVSFEHTDRRPFGLNWISRNKFALGNKNQEWDGDFTSYPQANLYRNFIGGTVQRLITDDQTLSAYSARVGRYKDEYDIDRRYFVELSHARVADDTLTSNGTAADVNYYWVYRHLDNPLQPTRGYALSTQSALGYASGDRQLVGQDSEHAQGPFARLYSRLSYYRPLGTWFGSSRLELGQVFSASPIGIPDPLLFRAGGQGSVRGYSYRTLGPQLAGRTTGGRSLLTASVEVAHPFVERHPEFLYAFFIDAGNAATSFGAISPVVGYGTGVRWRSPVGPLSLDLAYGEAVKSFRVYLNVGVSY